MLELGDLSPRRDWGYAPDYVEAMWLMMQQQEPRDYVIGSGGTRSVQDFVKAAFKAANIDDWESHVVSGNKAFIRPSEVNLLCADSTKAHEELGWRPQVGFEEMVARMVIHDIMLAERERYA